MAKNKSLIIFGLGDLARMAYFNFTHDSDYDVVAFTVTHEHIQEKQFLDLPIVDFAEIEQQYPPQQYDMFVAIGYSKLNKLRAQFFYEAKEKGYHLATYLSSRASILNDNIGENVFIFEDNTVQPFVTIGNDVILWSGNHIGHDAIIEDHCFFTSHVVLSGHTKVGAYSFLGVNATIRNNVTIGKECVIGAGAWINKNVNDREVYTTKPADLYRYSSDKLRTL